MKRRDFLKSVGVAVGSLAMPRLVFCGEPDVIRPVAGAPVPVNGGFSIAVLPDTQNYAWKYPDLFHAQTGWIAENLKKYNIRYVLQLGDVTEHNSDVEWKVARTAFARLDGKVPYAIAVGNHDMGDGGRCDTRESKFSDYFPVSHFKKLKTFGGVYDKEPEKSDNSFHLFDAGGRKWLVLSLELFPRHDVLRWANQVVAQHPSHSVIMITHAYLAANGTRFNRHQKDSPYNYGFAKDNTDLNGGDMTWRKLVSKHKNFEMVLCGHVCTVKRLTSKGESGNDVRQILIDYQIHGRGGDGWLRLSQFPPESNTVCMQDYSPVLEKINTHPDAQFDLEL